MKKHLTYLATTALLASPALAQDLTVTSFGGAYGAAQRGSTALPAEGP